jgi:hypothetical protein
MFMLSPSSESSCRQAEKACSLVLIAHNDLDRCQRRLTRDLVPSLRHYPDWNFELLVIDNSERRLDALADAVAVLPWKSQYLWHCGANLLYGPSMNLAANLAEHPFLLYACMNHGRMIDPTWIEDLIRPMWHDERVAMCGHRYPSPPPETLGFPDTCEHFHIQGGLLSARAEVIRNYPYDEGPHAHWGSDIWQSYRLMAAGFDLVQVPTVISVWRERAGPGMWKYIHDHAEI